MTHVLAATGHRPEKIHSPGKAKIKLIDALSAKQKEHDDLKFIQGCASGVDLWSGEICVALGIYLISARPWAGHAARKQDQELYDYVIDNSDEVHVMDPAQKYPGAWVYQNRNEWMVNHADEILAYWDGRMSGGTWNCIKYARALDKPIENIYV